MGRLGAALQSVLLPQQSLPGCWKLSGRATYLHCLQHLIVRELGLGVLDALHAERSLDYFVSKPFKLWIKEESRCVQSLCAIPWHLHGFTETVLSGLGKGLVNDDVESVYVKGQAFWASLEVLWYLCGSRWALPLAPGTSACRRCL